MSAARVSQWVSSGWLTGALVGEGRAAQIDVEKADALLRQRLNVGQVLGQGRELPPPPSAATPVPSPAPAPALTIPMGDDDAARLQKAKADQAEIAAERERRKNAEERGIYTLTSAARAAFARALGEWVQSIEIWLTTDLANALAAAVSDARSQGRDLDRRALVILIRTQFRLWREERAASVRNRAAATDQFISDLDLPEDPPTPE
ncbi:hypothetical protein [Magnetospirillum fulvum]|uniref:hypothetical protein n=1 Tax=Magnetospirillum fulvum TaxID=1082 RepID=UPI0012DE7ECC|nr:hypothetical protein [Magnetospirillum fulvum]